MMAGTAERRQRTNRVLQIAMAVLVFVGGFVYVGMLAQLSHVSKLSASVDKQITEKTADAQNLQVQLSGFMSPERIETRAQALGMTRANDTQIRVVRVTFADGEDMAQTADNSGASQEENP